MNARASVLAPKSITLAAAARAGRKLKIKR